MGEGKAYLVGMTLQENQVELPPVGGAVADAPAAPLPSLEVPRARMRYSVSRYHEAIAAGLLTENDRVELLFGEIVEKMPIGKRHGDRVDVLDWRATSYRECL